jgi:hypothetical protein
MAKGKTRRGKGSGGREGDLADRIIRRMEAVTRVAMLIKTADALPPGPLRERLGARVDRMMAALERTPLR